MTDESAHIVRPHNEGRIHEPLYGRLSIATLLLITTGSAAAVWVQHSPAAPRDVLSATVCVVMAPIYGTAMTALMISLRQRPTRPFATEPGHWLLLIVGSVFACIGVFYRMARTAATLQNQSLPIADILVFGVCLVAVPFLVFLALVLFVSPLSEVREPRRWKIAFRLLAASALPPCALFFFPVALAAILCAVFIDSLQHNRRDFWHWIGVVAIFAAGAHIALMPWLAAGSFTVD